jgi:anti-sigma B factor antagonist
MDSLDDCQGVLGAVEAGPEEAGVPVVHLVGEIDISNAGALGDELDALVGGVTGPLIVDLSGLQFMDSSGIAILLRVAGNVDSVVVRNPTLVVRRIIECTGLASVLRIDS